jgi:pimeloyl-ACP methyl ester carboxylesterase
MSHAIQIRRTSPPKEEVANDSAQTPALFEQMAGASLSYLWHGEKIHYRQLGDGPPLVLVHAPDVGACCLEWRRNVESLAASHTVYAVDLPGYGLSDVRPVAYTADTYVLFLADFLRDVPCRSKSEGTPVLTPHASRLTPDSVSAIGSVLGASYLVHVADRFPELLDRLVLIAPAGLTAFRPNALRAVTYQMMCLPGISRAVYGPNTSRYTILEHLQRDVYEEDERAGPQEVDWRYWVCHRKNADYVERSRLAGLLNTDIRGAVRRLRKPIMLLWGRRATVPPVSDAEVFCELNPRARLSVFERCALVPHEEEPHRFNQRVASFLQQD